MVEVLKSFLSKNFDVADIHTYKFCLKGATDSLGALVNLYLSSSSSSSSYLGFGSFSSVCVIISAFGFLSFSVHPTHSDNPPS
jgi:hypothetical protein